MAAEWPVVTFADAPFEIIDGDRGANYPKQADFSSGGHCLFLNAGNITSTGFDFTNCAFITRDKDSALRNGKLQRQDIVLTTRGTVGHVAYFDAAVPFDHLRINSGMVILRPQTSRILPRFLYAFLRSTMFRSQVERLRTGSAQPQLPIRDIHRITLPLPPLAAQHALAHILGTLDDKVELNRQTSNTLEALARTVFKSWFIDFDPVRAKAENRAPSGMDAQTASLFPSEFVASALGLIPKGWRVATVGELAVLSRGKQLERERIASEGSFPVFGGAGVMGFTTHSNADGFVISVGRVGAHCGQFVAHRGKAWINSNASLIRPADARTAEWLFFALKHVDIDVIKKGAAQSFVSHRDLAGLRLVWPDLPSIAAFANKVVPLLRGRDVLDAESKALARLRDELLPRLLSGDLSVATADNEGAAVA
jgi:type I restriction enzyme, S subunit